MADRVRVFLSAPQEPDKRIAALRAALAAWGGDYFYEERGKDAGAQLSTRVQQAISDSDIFLRVCTEATPRSYWMSLEAGAFLGLQSEEHRQGRAAQRRQVNLILSYDYAQEPFDRAGVLIDATQRTTLEWINELRDALGLPALADVAGLGLDLPRRKRTVSRRALVTAGLATGTLVFAGAAAGPLISQLNRRPIEVALPTPTPTVLPSATKKWAFATGDAVTASVAVANGVVYAGSWDGNLYALDAATGTKRWAFAVGGDAKYPVRRPPVVANGLVYIQATNPDSFNAAPVYALRVADGSQAWSLPKGRVISSLAAPLVANGVLYVPSYGGGLIGALDATSGRELAVSDSTPYSWGYSGVTLAGNLLYGGTLNGGVYAVDVTNGLAVRWQRATGKVDQSNAIFATPTVANGVVYVGSADGNLYALDAANGNPLWQYATGDSISYASPTVANGVVYVGSEDASLHAVDATTGKARWTYPTGGRVLSSPLVLNGLVYFGSNDHNVYALNAQTGKLVRTFATNGGVAGGPLIADGVLYVGSADNYVYAFSL